MSKLFMIGAPGPVGMLVVVGPLLLLAAITQAQDEHPRKYACYVTVTPGRDYQILAQYDGMASEIDWEKIDEDGNERIKCHDGLCQASEQKCRQVVNKIRGFGREEKKEKKKEGEKVEQRQNACYMVVARPSMLVRVHSGSWPNSRWTKRSIDKDGFWHKLCHHDKCNSHSIDTCKRVLRGKKLPEGWQQAESRRRSLFELQDGDESDEIIGMKRVTTKKIRPDGNARKLATKSSKVVCLKEMLGPMSNEYEGSSVQVTKNIFNGNESVANYSVEKCHDGPCNESSVDQCGPWTVLKFKHHLPRWVNGSIHWFRQDNDICVKQLQGGYHGWPHLTRRIYSTNRRTFRETKQLIKCDDDYCSQASIAKCGRWLPHPSKLHHGAAKPYWIDHIIMNDSMRPGDGRITWVRVDNDACFKSTHGNETIEIFSTNLEVYVTKGSQSLCHSGYCTHESIQKCGPWHMPQYSYQVYWRPVNEPNSRPGDGFSGYLRKWPSRNPNQRSSLYD